MSSTLEDLLDFIDQSFPPFDGITHRQTVAVILTLTPSRGFLDLSAPENECH
jgi:hypothetical protein